MKKEQNTKSRKRIIAFLLMLSLVFTTGTFAYWSSYVEGTQKEAVGTLQVGSGDSVQTKFNFTSDYNSGGLLVPEGQAVNSLGEAVEQIDLAFELEWVEDEEMTQVLGTGSVGQLEISHQVVISLDGEVLDAEEFANIYALINVKYNAKNASELTLDAKAKTFNFHITMDEPADQEEYNLIANADISITFDYSIDAEDIETTDNK